MSLDISPFDAAAYGGAGWSPRGTSLRDELGTLWRDYAVGSEWAPLRAVLLHAPGPEWDALPDADAAQMLAPPDAARARAQHAALRAAYEQRGVTVHAIAPPATPPPNLLFVADLFFMTPEGAIVGRPASTVRAGEERWVARRLADLGVPILRTVRGEGTFEGADAMWLDGETVLLGRGLRTNLEGAAQVAVTLNEMGVTVIVVDLPVGTMHLMGQLRLLDRDLALAWPYRLPWAALDALRARGYTVHFFSDAAEATTRMAFNVVTLGPREVLMPSGCPAMQGTLERLGVRCHTVTIDELAKAAGGIGCMSGVLGRGSRP